MCMNMYVVNMDGNILEVLAKNENELKNFLFSVFDLYSIEVLSVSEGNYKNDYPEIRSVIKTIPTIVK